MMARTASVNTPKMSRHVAAKLGNLLDLHASRDSASMALVSLMPGSRPPQIGLREGHLAIGRKMVELTKEQNVWVRPPASRAAEGAAEVGSNG